MARPRAADYDDKRRLILEAAAVLFAERGVAGTSMAMIAAAAGGTKAWLYHYYDGKDAIADDLLTGFLRELTDASSSAVAGGGDPEDRLRRMVSDVVRICAAAPGGSGLFAIADELPAPVARRMMALQKRFVSDLETVIVAVAPHLDGAAGRRKATVQSVLGMLHWQHRWWRPSGPLGLDEWADVVVALVLGGAPAVVEGMVERR